MQQPFDQNSTQAALSTRDEVTAFLDVSPLPAIVIDKEGRISVANNSARQFFVSEDIGLEGTRLADWVRSAESIGWLNEKLWSSGDANHSRLCEFAWGNAISVWAEVHARALPDGQLLLLIHDISDRKKAEKSLLASEKQRWKMQRTEALERLAGGIAHDFNNFLAVILLQTDMINLQLHEDSQLVNRVSEIRAVSNDAAAIVRQLLAFGRRQAMNPTPVVLNNLLEASYRDFSALLGEKIELALDLDPDLGVSFVDAGQIAQALMYLTIYARDAMSDGGRLTIKTSNIDKGGRLIHKTQGNGDYIQIEVIDTGIGIDPRVEDNIFEPFFSAKGSHKSDGLTLATVYGIVKQSGGFIWVTSVQNSGTTFKIQFPRIDQPKVNVKLPTQQRAPGHMQTILLLDDEISIRNVAAEGLRREGFRVLEAANGMDAIDIARTFPDTIDLIIADYSMPVMNGVEAAQRIKQFHAHARVIFISGGPDTFMDESTENGDAIYLGKPFSLPSLTKMAEDLLRARLPEV
ncbi:MAG: response regulator [Pyrinomonadaceae bacterium]